ncbi:hypothetical protein ACQ859_15220 [Roseateles chitinivorans]|uniref:hypothetical protein n=1 Tax=Roseateles chitinivorans TaxID=2917965 RepID=UPI003D66C3A3
MFVDFPAGDYQFAVQGEQPVEIVNVWLIPERYRQPPQQVIDDREQLDLHVRVSAQPGPLEDCYRVEISNSGARPYRDLTVAYADLLLWAERFGLDTTHMPANEQYGAGEPITIDCLAPGEARLYLRRGYGTHHRYDGPRVTRTSVSYTLDDQAVSPAEGHWCRIDIDLPGAS